ncbi:Uma2 family endonuclease [Spirulina sp. CS-785/01]|uniref:Uma2 family endonuclease n=1 Tax=Spirulina sp. CS-785/01 TaxID=3021716 RepID=UPI00232E485E|nr:Uma2 family endonuclease [Spirulina sp. CS-785/01]MDB9312456.1 Uma2 family endonuclease [Spirulina sp. CS-785/01]
MAIETSTQYEPSTEAAWEPQMPPEDLIFDDGEPLESNRHRIAMNVLIRSLQQAWEDRDDYFTGGNMFIYYSRQQARNRDFRGPDFFAVLDIDGTYPREGWVVWDENGRYPDVIIELMSPSTRQVDTGAKKDLYERVFRTRNYFVYDPFDESSLQGWQLDGNFQYQPLVANEQGWLWCDVLGFWVGVGQGEILRVTAPWLRFYHPDGNVVLMPEEAAAQQAEAATQQAEAATQQAEAATQQAEAAAQRAEAAEQRAETAEQRANRLAAQLRALGVEVEE